MKKILTICLLSIATNLMATEKDSVVTKSLDEVSVTSLYRNSVVTGSSLSREKLVSENHGQGPDYVFSKLPGIYAYNDNGLHMGYTYFRIRGMGQERMNVTLDGMPWNEAEDFGCYFSNSPDLMGSMQSIKVEKGASISESSVRSIMTGMAISDVLHSDDLRVKAQEKIESGLSAAGLEVLAFSISDLSDDADYIKSLSQREVGKIKTAAQSELMAQQKLDAIQAKKDEEVAKAKRKAEEERLKSTIMVETEIEADRKRAEAAGIKDKTIVEAEAEAEAIRLKATAEAEAIRLKKMAEAEGEMKFAEVKAKSIEAETAHIVALSNAKTPEQAMISWILRDQYKEIAEADAKKFEHISTGNVTVIGGSQEAGNFLLNTVKAVSEVSGVKDLLPGVSGLLGKAKKFDEKNGESFENVE